MRASAREKSIAPKMYISGFGAKVWIKMRASRPMGIGSPFSPNVRSAVSPSAKRARASASTVAFKPLEPRSPKAPRSSTITSVPVATSSSVVASATVWSLCSAAASRSKIVTRLPIETLDENVNRAAAGQPVLDGLCVADSVRDQARASAGDRVLRLFVDRRFDAAAADRAGDFAAFVDGHRRAGIARRRFFDSDDRRERDTLAAAAPAFYRVEYVEHRQVLRAGADRAPRGRFRPGARSLAAGTVANLPTASEDELWRALRSRSMGRGTSWR